MIRLALRHAVLLFLAFSISWWVVFGNPPEVIARQPVAPDEIRVSLESPAPRAAPAAAPAMSSGSPASEEKAAQAPELQPQKQEQKQEQAPEQPAPPAPELGSPLAKKEDQPQAMGPAPEESPEDVPRDSEQAESPDNGRPQALMEDASLLAAAALEVEGRGRKGFSTQLTAAPEDQLEIARTFGEELVLIPFRSVAPESVDKSWFRIAGDGTAQVERVTGPPPLSRYRQYRDLFDYEYSRLPSALRELRRAVLSRGEVYLFAALIPPREWALVIGRRRQALAQSGRGIEDVQTFKVRYRKLPETGFDVDVVEIVFSDGSLFRPHSAGEDMGTNNNQHPLKTVKSK